LLLAKFVAGSNLASLLAGKAGVSAARFLTYESIGSLTWYGTYIAVGYLFHGHLHWTLAQILRPLLIVRVGVFLARLGRRRSLAHAAMLVVATFTLAIVLLVRRVEPSWQVAFHRFAEISTGIAVALVMTVVWPERNATTSNQQGKDIPDEPTAAFGEWSGAVHRDPSS
jgi:hypothetical protein